MTKIKTPEPEDLASFNNNRLMHPSIVPSYHHQRMAPTAQASPAVRKPRRPSRALSPSELRARAEEREEMQSLLTKLKQLVPNAPKKRKTSKLEIIQSVIDYIFDLQVALESHPINGGAGGPIGPNDFIASYQQSQSQSQQPVLAMAAAAATASFDPSYAHHLYQQHHQQQHHSQQPSQPQYPLYECPQQQPQLTCDPSSYHHHQYLSQMTSAQRIVNPARPQERQPLASIML